MSVEVELSDLPLYTLYRDSKSRQLEEMLQNDLILVEHKVKRRRISRNPDSDPYVVFDPQDNELVRLDDDEIDALEGPRLFSFIKVRKELNMLEESQGTILIVPSLFLTLFITFLIVIALFPSLLDISVVIIVLSTLLILSIIPGYLAYRRVKSLMFFNRELVVTILNENPSFLESLRLLVDSSAKGWKKEEYRREFQYYEDALSRINQ